VKAKTIKRTKKKKQKTKKTKQKVRKIASEDESLDHEELEKNYGVGFKLLKGMGWDKGGIGKTKKGLA
jgi:hypothetical protein